jgi:hypothetical protein
MSTLPDLEHDLLRLARQATAERSRRRRRPRRTVSVVIAGALLLASGATATAYVLNVPWVVGTPTAPVPGPGHVAALSAQQREMDALKQPASAATTLPSDMQSDVSAVTQAGENPRLGRKALSTDFGFTFYVVPAAKGKVCLLVKGGAGDCSRAAEIPTGTFNGIMPEAPGGPVVYGLLPNRAADVALTLADGGTRSLRVTNNVWATQLPSGGPLATMLTWTDGGAHRQSPIIAPPSASPPSR